MTKNNRANKNWNNERRSNGGKNQARNSQPTTHTKAILKLKQAKRKDQQVKASFKNAEGVEVKETVNTFRDGDAKELLIELEKELIRLGNCYDLFKDGKWKLLAQLGG